MVKLLKRFRALPVNTQRLMGLGMVLALTIALPLFIWAVVTQKFLFNQRAASGEPPVKYGQPINWSTAYAELEASDFWITVNGKKFTGSPMINIHSDPGTPNYTTLEATWQENGVEMRLYMYFAADSQNWWLTEARIYDGNANGNWVYLVQNAQVFKSPLGTPYENGLQEGLEKNDSNGHTIAEVQFQNLTVQGFLNRTATGTVPCQRLTPSAIPFNKSDANPGPGTSNGYTIQFKNNDTGLCQSPYSDMFINFSLPGNGWSGNSSLSHLITTAGDSAYFDINIYNPPNTQPNQLYYPILNIGENNSVISRNLALPIPYYVQYYGAPTPPSTPTPPPGGYCSGANGSLCTITQCATCPAGRICPDYCTVAAGTCRNHVCIPTSPSGNPTPTPTATPTPSPNADCYTCNQNNQCVFDAGCHIAGPRCDSGFVCPTPPPPPTTSRSFEIFFKFDGVNDNSAAGANVTVRFVSKSLDNNLGYVTPPIQATYSDNGVYKLDFTLEASNLPAANDYAIILKGEKHLHVKFCSSGQTTHCDSIAAGYISLEANQNYTISLNFIGIPLPAGDTYPQDDVVDAIDFARITSLLGKPESDLTANDLLVGDLNYDGRINVMDVFLLRKTLETRYD